MLLIVSMVYLVTLATSWGLAYIKDSRIHLTLEQNLEAFARRSTVQWQISYLMLIINSSMNMVIYCFKDKQFRNVACQITRLDQLCRGKVTNERSIGTRTSKSKESEEPKYLQTALTHPDT